MGGRIRTDPGQDQQRCFKIVVRQARKGLEVEPSGGNIRRDRAQIGTAIPGLHALAIERFRCIRHRLRSWKRAQVAPRHRTQFPLHGFCKRPRPAAIGDLDVGKSGSSRAQGRKRQGAVTKTPTQGEFICGLAIWRQRHEAMGMDRPLERNRFAAPAAEGRFESHVGALTSFCRPFPLS